MVSLENFDPDKVEDPEFESLPAGDYVAVLESCEAKTTKAGNGTYWRFCFQVVDGKFKGRKVWCNINRTNPNKQAVDIGDRQLKRLIKAAGVAGRVRDTDQLRGKPLTIKVKCREYQGDIYNDVSAFKPLNGKPKPEVDDSGYVEKVDPEQRRAEAEADAKKTEDEAKNGKSINR